MPSKAGFVSRWRAATFAAAIAAVWCILSASAALASGSPYVVEDSEVDAPGSCKIDSSVSFASNRDFIGAATPACVVNLGRPVEVAVPYQTQREGGSWVSVFGLQGKTNLVSVETGKVGVGLLGAGYFNPEAGRVAAALFTVPVTFQVSEPLRFNVNGGWAWENNPSRHFFAWATGFELKVAEPVKLIGEMFGFVGQGNNRPRFQGGVRFTPAQSFDIDLTYGRNILGSRANWLTLGLTRRF